MKPNRSLPANTGFTLLEVLISMLIIALGLLGLAGMQVRMQQAEIESYQRSQALVLLYDMVERIQLNRATAACFAITTNTTAGTPYYGTGVNTAAGCTLSSSANNTMADNAKIEWDNTLDGASETSGGGASVGSIVGARGCVSYGTELLNPAGAAIPGTGIYTVSVAWQGSVDTVIPTANCANGLYGTETKRRVVSTTFRLAELN